MGKIAFEAQQVLMECCNETMEGGMIPTEKNVYFKKLFWEDDTTVLRDGKKIIREFIIESRKSGFVWLVMKIRDFEGDGLLQAEFNMQLLSWEAVANAIEAIIETQFVVNG